MANSGIFLIDSSNNGYFKISTKKQVKDAIDYIFNMVINRTYDGYVTEIKTIYGQLEKELNCKIEPAPDEWDRLYNVDFFIKINNNYIGIQIKPINQGIQLSQIFKEKGLQEESHSKFLKEFGGKVFYIFSARTDGKKVIMNPEVIDKIKNEISRLEE